MKKIIALAVIVTILLALCGCVRKDISLPERSDDGAAQNIKAETEFARTNCTESAFMWKKAGENIKNTGNLPVLIINSFEDFAEYKNQAEFYHSLDYSWDDNKSLLDIIDELSEDFFENNVLFLVYFTETSGSIRHNIINTYVQNGCFYANIEQVLPPGGGCTDDMAAWFGVVKIKREYAERIDSCCFNDDKNTKPYYQFEQFVYPGGTKNPVRVNVELGETFVFDNEDSLYLDNICTSLEYKDKIQNFDLKYIIIFYTNEVVYGVNEECNAIRKLDCTGENITVSDSFLEQSQKDMMKLIMLRLKGNL